MKQSLLETLSKKEVERVLYKKVQKVVSNDFDSVLYKDNEILSVDSGKSIKNIENHYKNHSGEEVKNEICYFIFVYSNSVVIHNFNSFSFNFWKGIFLKRKLTNKINIKSKIEDPKYFRKDCL